MRLFPSRPGSVRRPSRRVPPRRTRLKLEELETRLAPALSVLSPEFLVNTTTDGNQVRPAVARDSDGDFVIVWEDGINITAQRYNAAGVPRGGEMVVNTAAGNTPAVAMDADGDFVVAWQGNGVFARRYSADGIPQGGPFPVNTFPSTTVGATTIGVNAGGDFVVAWQSFDQDGNGYGVFAQRYDRTGDRLGGEFRVNTTTTGDQMAPAVAVDRDGDFVIAWEGNGPGDSQGVFAQRYNASGAAQGSQFRVNTTTSNSQADPAVGIDAAGNFVIAWESEGQDGSATGIYARRFDKLGNGVGTEFRANTSTLSGQENPTVAVTATGAFVIGWVDRFSSEGGFFAQSYNANGTSDGGEFRVTPPTGTGNLNVFVVAADADGNVVFVREGYPNDVFARQYAVTPAADLAPPTVANVISDGHPLTLGQGPWAPPAGFVVTFSEDMSRAGEADLTNLANWELRRQGQTVPGAVSSVSFGFNPATTKFEATVTFAAPLDFGTYELRLKDRVTDLAGNALDGDLNGTAGGDFVFPFTWQAPQPAGPEVAVNTTVAGDQQQPAVAADADGDSVVVWAGPGGIFAQRYNTAGMAQGAEIQVADSGITPKVGLDADGDFVITWVAGVSIKARLYRAVGLPQGDAFTVATSTSTIPLKTPQLAVAADGGFVLVYERDNPSYHGIFGQRFNAAGELVKAEFRIDQGDRSNRNSPVVALEPTGGFVVAWASSAQDPDASSGIYARRYASDNDPIDNEFRVNTTTVGNQTAPALLMGKDFFTVAWTSTGQDSDGSTGIYGRSFSRTEGIGQSEVRLNSFIRNTQATPTLTALPDGEFIAAWESADQDPDGSQGVYARRFNRFGTPQSGEFRIHTALAGSQASPAVAADLNGHLVIAWQGSGLDPDGSAGIRARFFTTDPDRSNPTVTAVRAGNMPLSFDVHGTQVRAEVREFVVTFSEDVSAVGGPSGAGSVTNPANWNFRRNDGASGQGQTPPVTITGITYGLNPASHKYEAVAHLGAPLKSGSYSLSVFDEVHDLAGNTLSNPNQSGGFFVEFEVLSSIARGPETSVSTVTAGLQGNPVTALDADGDYVIVWAGNGPGDDQGIFAQRFNANGVAQGPQFLVNQTTAGAQANPAVAMDGDGDFVVAWQHDTGDARGLEVYARRFTRTGQPWGDEFLVNTVAEGNQALPVAAMDLDGDFVIAWSGPQTYGTTVNDAVFARRFDSTGLPRGDQFLVNTDPTGRVSPLRPGLAMEPDGDFAIAWAGQGLAYFSIEVDGIAFRRYRADGLPQGNPVIAYVATENNGFPLQTAPAVALGPDGRLVVAWHGRVASSDPPGILARVYDASGTLLSTPSLRISDATASAVRGQPGVFLDGKGNAVIVWAGENADGSFAGIVGQQLDQDGLPSGSAFLVNTTTLGAQYFPGIAGNLAGDFVVAWQDLSGDSGDVRAQLFQKEGRAPGSLVADVLAGGQQLRQGDRLAAPLQQVTVTFAEDMETAGDSRTGNPSGGDVLIGSDGNPFTPLTGIANVASWRLIRNGVEVPGAITGVSYGYNPTTNRYEALVSLNAPFGGFFDLVVRDTVRDRDGQRLDGNFDGQHLAEVFDPRDHFVRSYSVSPQHYGPETLVNNSTDGLQVGPDVARDADGDSVVVWLSGPNDLYARRLDAAGTPQGPDILVTHYTTSPSIAGVFVGTPPAHVALDADGDFIVVWDDDRHDGSGFEVFARRFNALGQPLGFEFRVNSQPEGQQFGADVALDADGDFVIAWNDYQINPATGQGDYNVNARRFSAEGMPLDFEFPVHDVEALNQYSPAVAMDLLGNFVIAYASESPNGNHVYAHRFDATGAELGPPMQVDETGVGTAITPAVALAANGQFVIAWARGTQDGNHNVFARRYSAAGTPASGEFMVNPSATSGHIAPAVAIDANGNFLIAWYGGVALENGVRRVNAQRYRSDGTPQGAVVIVPTFATPGGGQGYPAAAMDADGDALVVYQQFLHPLDPGGIFVQPLEEQADLARPFVTDVRANGSRVEPGERLVSEVPSLVVRFSEAMLTGGITGFDSITNLAFWSLVRNGSENVPITRVEYGKSAATNKYEATLFFDANGTAPGVIPLTGGNYQLRLRPSYNDPHVGFSAVLDLAGNILDGTNNGGFGDFTLSFTIAQPGPVGPAESIASGPADQATGAAPSVAVGFFDPSGSSLGGVQVGGNQGPPVMANLFAPYVVAWTTNGTSIDGQIVNSQMGDHSFSVSASSVAAATVALLPPIGSSAVFVWTEGPNHDVKFDIRQFGSSVGTSVDHGPFQVNAVGTSPQGNPAVAASNRDVFAVAWEVSEGAGTALHARVFSAYDGTPVGAEFTVNEPGTGSRHSAAVSADLDGHFLFAWVDDAKNGNVFARLFSQDGRPLTGEFRVNGPSAANHHPAVAATPDGFVLAWQGKDGNGHDQVFVRRFNALAVPQGDEFLVAGTLRTPTNPSVTADLNGDFVVAWEDADADVSTARSVYARRFNPFGVPQGREFVVSAMPPGSQVRPTVAGTSTGDFVVAWTRTASPGDVLVQLYAPTPIVRGLSDVFVPRNATPSTIDVSTGFASVDDLTYSIVSVSNPALFSTLPALTSDSSVLTLNYAANAFGSSTIVVRASTGGAFVETSFQVEVAFVNYAPAAVPIPDVTVSMSPPDTVIDLFPVFEDLDTPDSALRLEVVSISDRTLFAGATIDPTTGKLLLDYTTDTFGFALVTVRATDEQGASTDVTFRVNVGILTGQADQFEPNEDVTQPTDLNDLGTSTPRTITANLHVPEDRDVYRFTIAQAAVVRLEALASQLGNPLDAALDLLDDVGNILASNDDLVGRDPALERLLQPGIYHVQVRSFGNSVLIRPFLGAAPGNDVPEGSIGNYWLQLSARVAGPQVLRATPSQTTINAAPTTITLLLDNNKLNPATVTSAQFELVRLNTLGQVDPQTTTQVTVTPADYNQTADAITLHVALTTSGPTLDGVYRLTVRDTLTSTTGVALDGDRDGSAGGDFVTFFGLDTAAPTGTAPAVAGVAGEGAGGTLYRLAGTVTDAYPAMAGETVVVELDVDGNGFNDGTASVVLTGPGTAYQLTATQGLTGGQGVVTAQVRFRDSRGNVSAPLPFPIDTNVPVVTQVRVVATTVQVTFNRADLLHVADPESYRLSGNVLQSVIFDPGQRTATLTPDTGLPDGTYTLTIFSGPNAITDGQRSLDGDANGLPGGNFVRTLVVDRSAPTVSSVRLDPAADNDRGVPNDKTTSLNQPSLEIVASDVFPNTSTGTLTVRLDTHGGLAFADGTAQVILTGTSPVTIRVPLNQPLAEGTTTIKVQVSDAASNSRVVSLAVTTDYLGPSVTAAAATPTFNTQSQPQGIRFVLDFDQPLDPARAENPSSYRFLAANGDGDFTDFNQLDAASAITSIHYDAVARRVEILVDIRGAGFGDDDYQLTARADRLTDVAGNLLRGGDQRLSFRYQAAPPRIVKVLLESPYENAEPTRALITFAGDDLDLTTVLQPGNYQLEELTGPGGGVVQVLPLGPPHYDANAARVILSGFGTLAAGKTYRLTVRDGIRNTTLVPLDGDGDSQPGGNLVQEFTIPAPGNLLVLNAQVLDGNAASLANDAFSILSRQDAAQKQLTTREFASRLLDQLQRLIRDNPGLTGADLAAAINLRIRDYFVQERAATFKGLDFLPSEFVVVWGRGTRFLLADPQDDPTALTSNRAWIGFGRDLQPTEQINGAVLAGTLDDLTLAIVPYEFVGQFISTNEVLVEGSGTRLPPLDYRLELEGLRAGNVAGLVAFGDQGKVGTRQFVDTPLGIGVATVNVGLVLVGFDPNLFLVDQGVVGEATAVFGVLNNQPGPTLILWVDPVDYILTDPEGRKVGYTKALGLINQVPGAYYSGDGLTELLIIPNALLGQYRLTLVGIGVEYRGAIGFFTRDASVTIPFQGFLAAGIHNSHLAQTLTGLFGTEGNGRVGDPSGDPSGPPNQPGPGDHPGHPGGFNPGGPFGIGQALGSINLTATGNTLTLQQVGIALMNIGGASGPTGADLGLGDSKNRNGALIISTLRKGDGRGESGIEALEGGTSGKRTGLPASGKKGNGNAVLMASVLAEVTGRLTGIAQQAANMASMIPLLQPFSQLWPLLSSGTSSSGEAPEEESDEMLAPPGDEAAADVLFEELGSDGAADLSPALAGLALLGPTAVPAFSSRRRGQGPWSGGPSSWN